MGSTFEDAIALVALTAMEIVLGIDNIVFIAVITGRLPPEQQARGRYLGLLLALATRIALLGSIFVVMGLKEPFLHWSDLLQPLGLDVAWLRSEHYEEINDIAFRDLILLAGGLFLIWKSVHEIHKKIDHRGDGHSAPERVSFTGVLVQVALLDIIFSLDSVITAVGMADKIWVMIAAVVIAMGVMLAFSGWVSRFVERNPTVKMLALSFLILIGVMLVADGIGTHFPKGYIYFAMVFALAVEVLNLRMRAVEAAGAPKPQMPS